LPSEPRRPPLPRRGNLTLGRGDPSSHPVFFLRAGPRNGLFHASVAIHWERLRDRRLLWNTMRPSLLERPVGFAYVRSCSHLAWRDRTRRIGIAEHMGHFPPQLAKEKYASTRNAAREASAFESRKRAPDRFPAFLDEAPIAAGAAP
jgi:hypothetical protein